MEKNYDHLQIGNKVWCLNPMADKKKDPQAPPYICGEITYLDTKSKILEVANVDKKIRFAQTMPFINEEDINISDMAAAADICEVDLLNNLTNRLVNCQEQFTNVGPTLLIVNPYKKDKSIYSHEKIEYYINMHNNNPPELRTSNTEPHLYDLVLISIEQLLRTGGNQSLIISGESGAGKTEAAKNAMKCIIYYFQGKTEEDRKMNMKGFSNRSIQEPLEKKILSCNPILEAFGNCKTIRNDNSSRFGKYVTINIDYEEQKVIGANITTYLLEKSRVTTQGKNERTFHIFYQLLNSGDSELLKSLHLSEDIKIYNYLNNSGCTKLKSIDDSKLYRETMECFEINDFSETEINSIFKILAAILLIGNIKFVRKGEANEIENMNIVKDICELLECKEEDFIKSLTYRITTIRGEIFESFLTLENCISSRDSLAKELYNRVFLWLVKKMNSRLDPQYSLSIDDDDKVKNIKYIGLLDIYGFECFETNSFEQLCINYTNEQLQHLYINDFFQIEIEELNREGLGTKANLIKYTDNQPIIDLIDLSPNGIFLKLDDCSFQNKSDEYFIELLKSELISNKYISLPRLKSDLNIKIKHSAKEVEYNCENFVEKNKDELKYSMVKIFANSNNSIIKRIFFNSLNEEETEKQIDLLEKKTKQKTSKFISGKFRSEMQSLVKELLSCQCSYVRCLKPNEQKKQFFVTPMFLFNQIQYLGILDTIKVRKEGFPTRKKYVEFFESFYFLFPQLINSGNSDKSRAQEIIERLVPNLEEIHNEKSVQYLLGKNKIFMKQEFNILLDNAKSKKIKVYCNSCEIIKLAVYHFNKKQKLYKTKENIENFQRYYRYSLKKINRKKKIEKIKNIQAFIKGHNSIKEFASVESHYIKVQTILRTFVEQINYEKKIFQLRSLSVRLNIFLLEVEKRKIEKLRNVAKNLLEQGVDNVIRKKYNELYQNLRPYLITLLAKKKYYDIYKLARVTGQNYNRKKVMKVFQMNLLFKKIQDRKESNKVIHRNFITTISSNYYFKLRESVLIIQYYMSRYIKKNNVIGGKIKKYFKEENKSQSVNELKLYLNIFPLLRFLKQNNHHYQYDQEMYANNDNKLIDNYNNLNRKIQKRMRRCSSMEKIDYKNNTASNKKLNPQKSSHNLLKKNSSTSSLFFSIGADYLQKNPEMNSKLVLLEHDEFKIPKIELFARILAIDILLDLNEIYDSDWGEEFQSIYEKNMNNHTPIELISVGESNTLLTNSIGKVYSFGWNNNCQCGINNKSSIQSYILPNIISNDQNETSNRHNKKSSFPVVYYEKNKNLSNLIGVSANYIHIFNESCFIINDKGDCYSFGNNENGQLGLGNPFPVDNPTLIKILKGKTKCIKCCQDFTIALTKDNEIFLWYCQSKNKINKINKKRNDFSNNNININTNKSFNNLFTTEESKEITDFIESGINYGIPFKINFLNKKIKISQISCGYNFAMLLAAGGILFCLGSNKNGELGLTEKKEELEDKNLNLKYFYSPVQNFILSDYYQEKIIDVKCGFKHTICLTSAKKVFAWGNNKYGQLGTGNFENMLVPVPIDLNVLPIEKIIQISAGFRNSVFFTENKNIYYTGILDKDNVNNYPTKFNVKLKSPEICIENKFFIVRILTSWSKNSSIFYATVADVRRYKSQNINKINRVMDILSKNWRDENGVCPRIDTISNFFSSTYMK